ncbi:MAG: Maf family protein [Gammaproteobacteria bacterium]|nr:Maf family protein [Gammaproteobacteria bacterium]
MTDATPTFVLASASPRRLDLLRQVGLEPEVRPVDIDETPLPGEAARDYVERLALAKARAAAKGEARPVLGSDTSVVVDGEILGKPVDESDAAAMLERLSGRAHIVMTAVAVVHGDKENHVTVATEVEFAPLSDDEIKAYWKTGEPIDKAGAYGIQGHAAAFIVRVNGSYSGVVGLPLHETTQLLRESGVEILEGWRKNVAGES